MTNSYFSEGWLNHQPAWLIGSFLRLGSAIGWGKRVQPTYRYFVRSCQVTRTFRSERVVLRLFKGYASFWRPHIYNTSLIASETFPESNWVLGGSMIICSIIQWVCSHLLKWPGVTSTPAQVQAPDGSTKLWWFKWGRDHLLCTSIFWFQPHYSGMAPQNLCSLGGTPLWIWSSGNIWILVSSSWGYLDAWPIRVFRCSVVCLSLPVARDVPSSGIRIGAMDPVVWSAIHFCLWLCPVWTGCLRTIAAKSSFDAGWLETVCCLRQWCWHSMDCSIYALGGSWSWGQPPLLVRVLHAQYAQPFDETLHDCFAYSPNWIMPASSPGKV